MKKITNCMTALIMAAIMVTLVAPVTAEAKGNVKLNKTKVTLSITNKTAKPSIRLKVKNATRKVAWKSSNKKVAAVNGKGTVTAKKAGKAVITARTRKKSLRCRVTVKDTRQPESVKKTPSKTPMPSKTPVPKCEHVYEDTWAHFEECYEMDYTKPAFSVCSCGLFIDEDGYTRHATCLWASRCLAPSMGTDMDTGIHGNLSVTSHEIARAGDKTYMVIKTDYVTKRTCTKCGHVATNKDDTLEFAKQWFSNGRAIPVTPPSDMIPVTPPPAAPPVTTPPPAAPPATPQPGA